MRYRFPRNYGSERGELRKSVPVLRQTHRYDRQRGNARKELQEIVDGTLEVLAVIQTRTQHNLSVHLNTGLGQPIHLAHKSVILIDTVQLSPQLRFRRVLGIVQRRTLMIYDTPYR